MVLPSSGLISLLDIQNEFGGTNPIGINEYYRNGGLVPANNTNVPTSGIISLADFYGAVNEIVKYITSTSTNVNASSYFTAGEWSSSAPKRLVINAGVTVGATNTSNYALNIPSGFGGTFRLDNNGSIQGAGGAANSGTGGSAIFAGAGISINNVGTIYAGGGGGGLGGTGGTGGQGTDYVTTYNIGSASGTSWDGVYNCNDACRGTYKTCPPGAWSCSSYCPAANLCTGTREPYYPPWNPAGECCTTRSTCSACAMVSYYYTSGGAGGAGGAGGRGRGYDVSAAAGSVGSAGSAGGTNAGTGGTGGTGGIGGDWGTTGSTGSTGATGANGTYTNGLAGSAGSGGGLAGYYIVNNGNVTWIATGTRAGRVG
jgi:hypothetical protein